MANSCRDQCPAPEGRHSRSPFHAAVASDATTVSPFQGFQTWLSDSPTAHAVGYDLPPSGLKTQALRTLSSQETDVCGKGRPKAATSPKHRMSLLKFSDVIVAQPLSPERAALFL